MNSFLNKAHWTTEPDRCHFDGKNLHVESSKGSDFWQETHYGFNRDTGHALLAPVTQSGSLEVTFVAGFNGLYDQAGLMIRNNETDWIKAGIEVSDSVPHAGAVVTHGHSDWSLSPVPDWAGQEVTIRASWHEGAVTIRARKDQEPWRTLRLAPMNTDSITKAGLYVCSPERSGLNVAFSRVSFGTPDAGLHTELG